MLVEQRVAEDFLQLRGEAGVRVVGEGVETDVEDRGQLDQKMRGKGPLLMLDEVEIAGRDLEAAGKVALGELLAPAQRAHLGTEAESFVGHGDLRRPFSVGRCPLRSSSFRRGPTDYG